MLKDALCNLFGFYYVIGSVVILGCHSNRNADIERKKRLLLLKQCQYFEKLFIEQPIKLDGNSDLFSFKV